MSFYPLKSLSATTKRTVQPTIAASIERGKMDAEELEYIYKIMEKLTGTHDLATVAQDIVRIMITALDCIGGALLLVDERNQVLRPYTYSQIGVFLDKVIPLLSKSFQDHLFDLKDPQNFTARTVTEKRTFIGHDYRKFMDPVLSGFVSMTIQKVVRMKTIVTAPTIIQGQVVGVLMIGFRETELSPRKRKLLHIFCDQCALAVNNARKFEKLRDMVQHQSEFSQMAAHELRTPLSIALFQAEDLAETLRSEPFERKKALATTAVVEASLARLARVTNKILDLQLYELGQVQLDKENIPVSELLKAAERDCQALLEESRVQLVVENTCADKAAVVGDFLELLKLLKNLIENAVRFSPAEKPILLRAEQHDRAVVLAVSDQGQGVPDEQKKTIFDKLRGDSLNRGEGLGVGLTICQHICELHGGKIWVEDEMRGGARFVVRVPDIDG